jgi:ABC-2 type transport system permease protein
MDSLKLYWLYAKLSIRVQLQYRAAFLLAALGQCLITGIEFLGVWAFFERFGRLHHWSLPEVAVFGTGSV